MSFIQQLLRKSCWSGLAAYVPTAINLNKVLSWSSAKRYHVWAICMRCYIRPAAPPARLNKVDVSLNRRLYESLTNAVWYTRHCCHALCPQIKNDHFLLNNLEVNNFARVSSYSFSVYTDTIYNSVRQCNLLDKIATRIIQ